MYQLNDAHEEAEQLDSEDDVVAANHWLLPSTQFNGLWESLVYDDNIKNNVSTRTHAVCHCLYVLVCSLLSLLPLDFG